jgi:hypothetical protein
MYEYTGDFDIDLLGDHADQEDADKPVPDDDAVLLDVAARFADEHGVARWRHQPTDRSESLWRAAAAWPGPIDEAYELLRDAVDARDLFPRLWVAATEEGRAGGWELRQLAQQHREDPWADNRRLDADLAAGLATRPDLWHAVWRANRFLVRLRGLGVSDDQILGLLDEYAAQASSGQPTGT